MALDFSTIAPNSLVKDTIDVRFEAPDSILLFGRYQNEVSLYQPIQQWMYSREWNDFREYHCSRYVPGWDALTDEKEIHKQKPFRVAQFFVEIGTDENYKCTFCTNNDPAELLTNTVIYCELNERGYSSTIPEQVLFNLMLNAITNISILNNPRMKRLVIIDIYPDRPPNTILGFHTDSGLEYANRNVGLEDLECVSLLFLPDRERLMRGTVLSPAVSAPIRNSGSLLCNLGTTIIFLDSAVELEDQSTLLRRDVPYVIHATPDPLATRADRIINTPITGSEISGIQVRDFARSIPASMTPESLSSLESAGPRSFVRTHLVFDTRYEYREIVSTTISADRIIAVRPSTPIVVNNSSELNALFAADSTLPLTGGTIRNKKRNKTRKVGGTKPLSNVLFKCEKCDFYSYCKFISGLIIKI